MVTSRHNDLTKPFPETRGMVAWSRTGDLSWRGVGVDEEMDGAFARLTFTARLISPRIIRGESRFAFNLNAPSGMNPASIPAGMGCLTATSWGDLGASHDAEG